MPNAMVVELHFQEGFTGDTVIVTVEGRPVGRFAARTRLQTGLAHVETVSVTAGGKVGVSIPALAVSAEFEVAVGTEYVTVNLKESALRVAPSPESPGYI